MSRPAPGTSPDLDKLFRVPRNHEGPAQGRDISLVIWQVYKQTLHSQDLLFPNFSLSQDRHQTTISLIAEDWKLRIFSHLKVVLTSFLGETCPDSPLLSSCGWVRASSSILALLPSQTLLVMPGKLSSFPGTVTAGLENPAPGRSPPFSLCPSSSGSIQPAERGGI